MSAYRLLLAFPLLAVAGSPLAAEPRPEGTLESGGARAEVLRAVGPLDERYFMYFEDVDYCRRARRAGWSSRPTPGPSS